jgi:DNA-binding GntR family transcriptional regulator
VLPIPGRVADTLAEHRAIVAALAARDPAAARGAVQAHLGQLLRFLEPLERDRPDLFKARP